MYIISLNGPVYVSILQNIFSNLRPEPRGIFCYVLNVICKLSIRFLSVYIIDSCSITNVLITLFVFQTAPITSCDINKHTDIICETVLFLYNSQ